MKLYELKRDDKFKFEVPLDVAQNEWNSQEFTFVKIDGMYSICLDENNEIHHIAAYAPVVKIEPLTEEEKTSVDLLNSILKRKQGKENV